MSQIHFTASPYVAFAGSPSSDAAFSGSTVLSPRKNLTKSPRPLTTRQRRPAALGMDPVGHQRVAPLFGSYRPVRTKAVVAVPEIGQATPPVHRVPVDPPVHLFRPQRLMKSLQQAQLLRRPI